MNSPASCINAASLKSGLSFIEMLWKIALVDLDLDKYEDYMIAKIADLLYIARGDVMRLKQRVAESLGSE